MKLFKKLGNHNQSSDFDIKNHIDKVTRPIEIPTYLHAEHKE